jgi:ABC-type multidrug transport system permease subunit
LKKLLSDSFCIFQIHLARLRAESGPFLLAAIVFPIGMYLFANGVVAKNIGMELPNSAKLHFLAASLVFSLSLTAISWFGYLLLENRFTGRLKLFATLPITTTSYVFGVLVFALAQGAVATVSMLVGAWLLGVTTQFSGVGSYFLLALVVFLSLISLCGISLIISARVRSFSEGSLMTDALGAGLVLLAPIYYPSETLPKVLQWLGVILPTTYIFESLNKLLSGNSVIGYELSILACIAVVTLLAGFSQLKWREN